MEDTITLTREEYKAIVQQIVPQENPPWKKVAGFLVTVSLMVAVYYTGIAWWQALLFYFLGALAAILKARKW